MADDDWDLGVVVQSYWTSGTKVTPMVLLEVELQEATTKGDKVAPLWVSSVCSSVGVALKD